MEAIEHPLSTCFRYGTRSEYARPPYPHRHRSPETLGAPLFHSAPVPKPWEHYGLEHMNYDHTDLDEFHEDEHIQAITKAGGHIKTTEPQPVKARQLE